LPPPLDLFLNYCSPISYEFVDTSAKNNKN
jgi:hypothetical protein